MWFVVPAASVRWREIVGNVGMIYDLFELASDCGCSKDLRAWCTNAIASEGCEFHVPKAAEIVPQLQSPTWKTSFV